MPAVTTSPQRLNCTVCLRPQRACICRWITPTAHQVEVVVLQHPLEVHQAKGSARLLHLSLPHSVLVTGEVFTEATLQALISAPRHTLLLYPESPANPALGESPPPAAPAPNNRHDTQQLRLIVLDGTWRKSRKMLYLNPLLQRLPRLALKAMPASRYRIRKAHLPDQLSTLEATCAALAQLEGDAGRFEPLLTAFDGFVAQQSGYMPASS